MEILHSSPSTSSFTPLSTHQSQTPDSFYEGLPVLHYHTTSAQIILSDHDLRSTPVLASLSNTPNSSNDKSSVNGHQAEEQATDPDTDTDVVLQLIDVWVTSEYTSPPPSPLPFAHSSITSYKTPIH